MVSVAASKLCCTELFFVESQEWKLTAYSTVKFCWRTRRCQSCVALHLLATRLCSSKSVNLLVKRSSSFSRKHRIYLSRSVVASASASARPSGPKPGPGLGLDGLALALAPGWLLNLETDAATCVQDTSPRHQRLIDTWGFFLAYFFGVAHAPFACQRWGLPYRLAQCATPGKGLV